MSGSPTPAANASSSSSSSSAVTLGDTVSGATPDFTDEQRRVAEWTREQVADEVRRVRAQGVHAIAVPVRNTCVVRESDDGAASTDASAAFVNRIEVDSSMDFRKIKQLLVSAPRACPVRPGFFYVNVVAFTAAPLPLLLPYLFDNAANPLTVWEFLNNKQHSVRHEMQEPTIVGDEARRAAAEGVEDGGDN